MLWYPWVLQASFSQFSCFPLECRNVDDVLLQSPPEKSSTIIDENKNISGLQSEHSSHSNIPVQDKTAHKETVDTYRGPEFTREQQRNIMICASTALAIRDTKCTLACGCGSKTDGEELSGESAWLNGITKKSDIELMVLSKLFEHEMTCPICGNIICEHEERIEIPDVSGKAYTHDTCYKEKGVEGKHWYEYAGDIVLRLEHQFGDDLERKFESLEKCEDIWLEPQLREDDEKEGLAAERARELERQAGERRQAVLDRLQREKDEENEKVRLAGEKYERERQARKRTPIKRRDRDPFQKTLS
jgi:hypothetical protein